MSNGGLFVPGASKVSNVVTLHGTPTHSPISNHFVMRKNNSFMLFMIFYFIICQY